MKPKNRFLSSDIRIQTDSAGMMTARHKFQGTLLDWDYYDDRGSCRREAVKALKELKETSK